MYSSQATNDDNETMVSVIVPIYNTERYLHRCLDSILAQSYKDFELLLIDDGSTDDCGAICDEYVAKDSRVRVFHKENGGVSSARNFGIEKSKGEWIVYIDSDDYVHKYYLESLCTQHDSDLVIGSFRLVGTDENWDGVLPNERYNRQTLAQKLVKSEFTPNYRGAMCKLYRRDIIIDNHIRYDEKLTLSEDWLFTLHYFQYVQSIHTIDAPYYYYERGNVNGLSQNSRYFDEYFYAMEQFDKITSILECSFSLDCLQRLYLESVHIFFCRQIAYLYHHMELPYCVRLEKVYTMLSNSHVQAVIHDNTILDKGPRRKMFDVLARLFPAPLLLFYIRFMRGNVY